eukprot:4449367-Pyramimonas_sp.AAC.1
MNAEARRAEARRGRKRREETRGPYLRNEDPKPGWQGDKIWAKDRTICSCECRSGAYPLRWSSLWGHDALE